MFYTFPEDVPSNKHQLAQKPTVSTSAKPRPQSAKPHTGNKSLKTAKTRPQSAGLGSQLQNGADTARTDATHAS